ncbi:ABC transporter substrate-binding protein [Acinetobacter nectaris]|uniref:ABC transporter substrate-binding protein n=1 Tax=Acinetobacter nectaris TaxID=1219382 RepID=UPI001F3AAD9D|nr:ABC transporter substrate-binding protein [Acinetobacter nectaris]MCF8998440.1 ABC transporter substrate-binding protein [Acinetobacter nectaris]MCF9027558.1 ABC transporter substrate-binding protein [Acinetobacter nectaris]
MIKRLGAMLLLAVGSASFAAPVTLQMYYPIVVGGKVQGTIEGLVNDFMKQNPDIKINPIYTGDYVTTVTKALTAYRGHNAPQVAVMGDIEVYSLKDAGAIIPVSDLVKNDPEGQKWLSHFYPAFIRHIDGKVWSVPFQRSTNVMYWNKEAFKKAGLNPEHPPQTWQELTEYGKKLTIRQGNTVTQWGVEVPSNTPNGYWPYQAFVASNGGHLDNGKGTAVTYYTPKTVEALSFLHDLSVKYNISPKGVIADTTTPQDFIDGKSAMVFLSTGNLGEIRQKAKFPFGVSMIPEKTQRGSPTGGGSLYMFSGMTPDQQKAALKLVRWLSEPEQAARWSIATGYIATSPAAWETKSMQAYAKQYPQALVAREQLKYSQPELSTYRSLQVKELLNRAIEATVTGRDSADNALKSAQSQADRLLKPYQ